MSERRLAVLGSPIAHSLSPIIHRAAYSALGLPWRYDAIDVDADHLDGFLDGLGPQWRGLSLTMPLKQRILPRLTAITDTVDEAEAANTVIFEPDLIRGENTDVPAMVDLLGDVSADLVVVLGSGATARSVLVALDRCGATSVVVASRSRNAALTVLGDRLGVAVEYLPLAGLGSLMGSASGPETLLISTLPGPASAEVAADLRPCGRLLDVAYDPWPTPLARCYQGAGLVVTSGIELLVRQAALQVELFTGLRAPIQAMYAALDGALGHVGGSSG